MKKNHIFYFLVAVSTFFVGCKKDDGPIPKSVAVERVPAPLILKDATGTAIIDLVNLAAFNGKYTVGLYFPGDIPPSKMDIVMRKNGNNSNIKILQAGVTTFPFAGTVTAAQLVSLFGAPIAVGDQFEIGADIYAQSGKKYEAFPVTGLGYAAAFQPDHPGFSPSVIYTTNCPFDPTKFVGTFKVVTDTWADYSANENIAVKPGPAANQLTITAYPSTKYGTNRRDMIINVTPQNVVTIPEQIIGDYFTATPGVLDKDITIKGAGTVNSCSKTITLTGLRFSLGMGGPDYGGGAYALTIRQL